MIRNCIRIQISIAFLASGWGCSKSSARPQPKEFAAQVPQSGITVQDLNEEETFSGAGTTFSLLLATGESPGVFFGYGIDTDEPIIRVNNKPYKLKSLGSKVLSKGKGPQELGKHEIETWGNEAITIELDYRTISVGEAGVGYKGRLKVKLNGKEASFNIVGGFGC